MLRYSASYYARVLRFICKSSDRVLRAVSKVISTIARDQIDGVRQDSYNCANPESLTVRDTLSIRCRYNADLLKRDNMTIVEQTFRSKSNSLDESLLSVMFYSEERRG